MNLIEVKLNLTGMDSILAEILPYQLSLYGYEGFIENLDGFSAFIEEEKYDRERLRIVLSEYSVHEDRISEFLLPEKNWNEEWEKNFEPVFLNDRVYIRAPFHRPDPSYEIEIIIEPKMSFGTGHHATTSMMIDRMMDLEIRGTTLLDAGCGTGILSIFAEKLGAQKVIAIDIDDWCHRNALENIAINQCYNIDVVLGDITADEGSWIDAAPFDGILANINLNILKSSMGIYSRLCRQQGFLLVSGILTTDIQPLKEDAESNGFAYEFSESRNNWAVIGFRKK